MKRVICPKCKNATIQVVSGNTVIPLNFDDNDIPSDATTNTKKDIFKKIKKTNYNFQCYSCGTTFSKKM